jgi:hypothetical protein
MGERAMLNTLHQRVLRRAATILGGIEQLRHFLDVDMSELVDWLEGVDPIPTDVFLQAVDVVSRELTAGIKHAPGAPSSKVKVLPKS